MIVTNYTTKSPLIRPSSLKHIKITDVNYLKNNNTGRITYINFILSMINNDVSAYIPEMIEIVGKDKTNGISVVALTQPESDLNKLIGKYIIDANVRNQINVIDHDFGKLEWLTDITLTDDTYKKYTLNFSGICYAGKSGAGHPVIYHTHSYGDIRDTSRTRSTHLLFTQKKRFTWSCIKFINNKIYLLKDLGNEYWNKSIKCISMVIELKGHITAKFKDKDIDTNNFELKNELDPCHCMCDFVYNDVGDVQLNIKTTQGIITVREIL